MAIWESVSPINWSPMIFFLDCLIVYKHYKNILLNYISVLLFQRSSFLAVSPHKPYLFPSFSITPFNPPIPFLQSICNYLFDIPFLMFSACHHLLPYHIPNLYGSLDCTWVITDEFSLTLTYKIIKIQISPSGSGLLHSGILF